MRIVLDWDGTAIEDDALNLVVRHWGDVRVWEELDGRLGTDLTLNEVIAAEVATVAAPLEAVAAWLVERIGVRPGFHELVRDHDVSILSSGFRELIEPVLAREGVGLEVHANALAFDGGRWRAVFRDDAACATCAEACKRASLPAGAVFVGDGYSDRCAALAAARVFARDALASWLDEQGHPYEPFTTLHDVARALDKPAPPAG